MLDRLDDVDWASLGHAYGSADDVPGLIRALREPDEPTFVRALGTLYSNIFHQGTRYEASAHAVAFLLELAEDPAIVDRSAIVRLVTHLAVGYDEVWLPHGVDVATIRRDADGGAAVLAAVRAAAEDEDEDDVEDDEDRDDDVEAAFEARFDYEMSLPDADQVRLFAHIELAVYEAVRSGAQTFRGLLADADPEVRTVAAHALAWFPDEAAANVAALAAAAADPVSAVAATALVALGLNGDPSAVPVAEAALGDARDVVRWGAAIALARLCGATAHPAAATTLLAWAGGPSEPSTEIPFLDGDLAGYAAIALVQLGDGWSRSAFESLVGRLPHVYGSEALTVAGAALRQAFPAGRLDEGTPFAALDETQQRLVRVLAGAPGSWLYEPGGNTFGNFRLLMSGYGLPADAEAMRVFAFASETTDSCEVS